MAREEVATIDFLPLERVFSSIGRAARLQRAGQWFDSTNTQRSVFTIKTSAPCTQLEALSGPYLLSQAEVTVAYTKIADMVELVDTLGLGPRGE